MTEAASIIALLNMTPHPEGGHFVETFRDATGSVSLIVYLLEKGERSHWHRLKKAEILHFYDGDPLALLLSPEGFSIQEEGPWTPGCRSAGLSSGRSQRDMVLHAVKRRLVADRLHRLSRFFVCGL
ncbi:MAG: cupin domain-containing protein [Arenicellales bacterium]|jgi:predicted cupin superfamily sugar epimerase|nr:cupin domain-containing protein [Arenicellales bacterium]|tara:strand:- start:175 stop:552 length:378 start_codon:yes stop_codon:yes gene_type:complete